MTDSNCPLHERQCLPCQVGASPLAGKELEDCLHRLAGGWASAGSQRIEKEFSFRNFREALDFTIRVGELAEEVGHHPTITLSWGKVKIALWTHKIHGLAEADFVLAARIDRLPGARG